MSTRFVLILAALGVVALLALACFTSYIGAYNYGNTQEKLLDAKWQDNQNVLGQYTLKVGEMAQVPEAYRDDLLQVITKQFQGRYGADGSKATWQWLQEHNLNLDPAMYNRLQQTMESGRNDFKVSQTELIDIKRSYETALGSFWQGLWLKAAGYPKVDLGKYKVVLAADTAQKFTSGVDNGIQLRKPTTP